MSSFMFMMPYMTFSYVFYFSYNSLLDVGISQELCKNFIGINSLFTEKNAGTEKRVPKGALTILVKSSVFKGIYG